MNKNVVVPVALFFSSVLFSLMVHPIALLIAGAAICLFAMLKYRVRQDAEPKLGVSLLFRSGLAVTTGAIAAAVFVFTAMSGLLSK